MPTRELYQCDRPSELEHRVWVTSLGHRGTIANQRKNVDEHKGK